MLCQPCVFASGGICGSRSAFRCVRGVNCRCTIFHSRVVPVRIWQNPCLDTLRQTCVYASGGICGPRSAFRCLRGVKCYGWDRYYFSCSGGTSTDLTKSAPRRVTLNIGFASGGFSRSRNALWCLRGVKCRRTNFHIWVGLVRI
jgi:hypothetical protein